MKLDPTKIPIRASTQEHLDIEDVRDDLVILKDGSCILILTTTAINYGLLSEKEQEAIIHAYAALLNSLTFSIQIVMRSQKKDVSGYLKLLEQAEEKETKKEVKEQIKKYKEFVKETVAKNEVLDKEFYLAIPMSALELGVAQTLTSVFRRQKGLPFPKKYILEKAKTNLYPKRDHLLRQLNRLGLKGKQLTTQELIQLFFEIYNPEVSKLQVEETAEYQAPIVQPAKTVPSPEPESAKTIQPEGLESEKPISAEAAPPPEPEKVPIKEESLQDEIDHLVKKSI